MTPGLATEVVAKQTAYLDLFGRTNFATNILHSATPIPDELASILTQINLLRAHQALGSSEDPIAGVNAIIEVLEAVHLDQIADEATRAVFSASGQGSIAESNNSLAARMPNAWEAWISLLEAYRGALTLYAINSVTGVGTPSARMHGASPTGISADPSRGPALAVKEDAAYHSLVSSLDILFVQRERRLVAGANAATADPSDGILHKFVIWPLLMAGIEATLVYFDDALALSLCTRMSAVRVELGTASMLEAAQLVGGLKRERRDNDNLRSWDTLFWGSPVFLM